MEWSMTKSVEITQAITSYYEPVNLAMGMGIMAILVVVILSLEKPFNTIKNKIKRIFTKKQ